LLGLYVGSMAKVGIKKTMEYKTGRTDGRPQATVGENDF